MPDNVGFGNRNTHNHNHTYGKKQGTKAHAVYKELYALYKLLHDSFGTPDGAANHYKLMKKLLRIRNAVR